MILDNTAGAQTGIASRHRPRSKGLGLWRTSAVLFPSVVLSCASCALTFVLSAQSEVHPTVGDSIGLLLPASIVSSLRQTVWLRVVTAW